MKKILIFLKNEVSWLIRYLIFCVTNFKYLFDKSTRLIFLGTPFYDNIGDLGIYIAEKEYFQKEFNNVNLLEIPLNLICKHQIFFSPFIKNNPILFIGGGFLGTIWIDNEIIVRKVIKRFKNNSIIILPQTMYYEDSDFGIQELQKSKKIYGQHSNLVICLREDMSFVFAQKNFLKNKILYAPDSVLCLKVNDEKCERKNICFCLRKDKEKLIQLNILDAVKEFFPNTNIVESDMMGNCKVNSKNRHSLVYNKLKEFKSYQLVITDRLHGMIFSAISSTPVIAFDNKTHKIREVYKKLSKFPFVKFVQDNNDFENKLKEMKKLLDDDNDFVFDQSEYRKGYIELTKEINRMIKSDK